MSSWSPTRSSSLYLLRYLDSYLDPIIDKLVFCSKCTWNELLTASTSNHRVTHLEYFMYLRYHIKVISSRRVISLHFILYVDWTFNSGTDFFFREIIKRSEIATEWDTWQLCTSVCAKPEVSISPHSLCGGPWVNVYNSVRRISRRRRKCSNVCALISVSVCGKLVLKRTKCCKQLSESPA